MRGLGRMNGDVLNVNVAIRPQLTFVKGCQFVECCAMTPKDPHRAMTPTPPFDDRNAHGLRYRLFCFLDIFSGMEGPSILA
jgi:hypothetical protein